MWSSKMAARWRGKDGDLNAGNCDFLTSNTPSEVLSRCSVEMDTQSCMDQSILAIFEDSTVASEDKSVEEEESETLLSALSEMLDSVEDDNGTLSPFDTLPDTKLLTQLERSYNSGGLADRLRPRSKLLSLTPTVEIEREKEDECETETSSPPQLFKQQTLFHTKAEADVEVFTSTSLVNLVKLMHPYCLKLQVEEEEDELRRNHTFFSLEEVWKYERPTEESDEEINVVSDEEVTVKTTKEGEEGEEVSDNGKLLKSVLLDKNAPRNPPSRQKKRVSFGPVQVASLDETEERDLTEKGPTSETVSPPLSSTKAPENPAHSALEPQTQPSETNCTETEALPLKGETKTKSLSLQQYRQLRQKRQPLVEKQGNYTTKWPSVSEPPKELTPILCLQSQSCGPKTAQHYPDDRSHSYRTHRSSAPPRSHPSEATPLRRSGSKRQRTESKRLTPASPLPDVPANLYVAGHESKTSPVKKATLLSSDPPNPVLLPLSVGRTTSPPTDSPSESRVEFLQTDLDSARTSQETQSSGAPLQQQLSSLGPKPDVLSLNQDRTVLLRPPGTLINTQTNKRVASCASDGAPALSPTTIQDGTGPQPQICSLNSTNGTTVEPKTQVDAHIAVEEVTLLDVPPSKSSPEEPLPAPQFDCRLQSASTDSGIEAPDLTSLLEQFEETQAKEDRVESSSEQLKPLSTSDSPGTPNTLRNLPHLHMAEGVDIPEPFGTEIILSTQPDLPVRRKNPSTKAIQIIDPRPLLLKKSHSNLSEFPPALTSPHMFSSISSDHDYCGPVDGSLTNTTQRVRAPKLKETTKTSDEVQAAAHDSSAAAACTQQTSSCDVNTTTTTTTTRPLNDSEKSVPEKPRTGSDTTTDTVLPLSECAATEQDYGCAAGGKSAACTLPTPPPSPPVRGRDRRRYRRRSPRSDSSSSSCSSSSSSSASRSPKRQKRHYKRSESSSCSSSRSRSFSRSPPRHRRWSYSRSRCSRSRSRSWSRSPSRSRSPVLRNCHRQQRDGYSNRESRKLMREHEIRVQKLKAIDERRVVYVGRICRSMTHDELGERFCQFGEVECVSLHFRERGDHYGFVTFYNMSDAFAAIDNGSKLRRPDELPFDLCFGGRRQFCNSNYADLDANRDAEPSPAKSKFEDLDFDQLLKQAQKGLKR